MTSLQRVICKSSVSGSCLFDGGEARAEIAVSAVDGGQSTLVQCVVLRYDLILDDAAVLGSGSWVQQVHLGLYAYT